MLEINTVFDLASSRIFRMFANAALLFANAALFLGAGVDTKNTLARCEVAPSDAVTSLAVGDRIDDIRFKGIEVLEGLGTINATAVAQTLDLKTVRDLALWPLYLAAYQILKAVFLSGSVQDLDSDAPGTLLPKSDNKLGRLFGYSGYSMMSLLLRSSYLGLPQTPVNRAVVPPYHTRFAVGYSWPKGFQNYIEFSMRTFSRIQKGALRG